MPKLSQNYFDHAPGNNGKESFSLLAALFCSLFALLIVICTPLHQSHASESKKSDKGERKVETATEISRSAIDSALVSDSMLNGKVVYVDFWASWCVPCKLSFPWLVETSRRYAAQGLRVVTVNLDEERSRGEKFYQQYGSDLTVIYDEKGKLAEQYQIDAMPTALLFDRAGKLVATHRGFREKDRPVLDSLLRTLMSNSESEKK